MAFVQPPAPLIDMTPPAVPIGPIYPNSIRDWKYSSVPKTDLAIGYFSNAIDIDPDNHVVKIQPIYYLSTVTTITPYTYPMNVL
jgi:hypothetical protein